MSCLRMSGCKERRRSHRCTTTGRGYRRAYDKKGEENCAACGWCDYSDSCGYSWNRNDSKKESSR